MASFFSYARAGKKKQHKTVSGVAFWSCDASVSPLACCHICMLAGCHVAMLQYCGLRLAGWHSFPLGATQGLRMCNCFLALGLGPLIALGGRASRWHAVMASCQLPYGHLDTRRRTKWRGQAGGKARTGVIKGQDLDKDCAGTHLGWMLGGAGLQSCAVSISRAFLLHRPRLDSTERSAGSVKLNGLTKSTSPLRCPKTGAGTQCGVPHCFTTN